MLFCTRKNELFLENKGDMFSETKKKQEEIKFEGKGVGILRIYASTLLSLN